MKSFNLFVFNLKFRKIIVTEVQFTKLLIQITETYTMSQNLQVDSQTGGTSEESTKFMRSMVPTQNDNVGDDRHTSDGDLQVHTLVLNFFRIV